MKSKFRFHLCCICMFALAIAGCKVKRPDDVIPESKMENLLYDYHLAKAMGDNLPYNENYKKALYIDVVFKKYSTTQAVFDSSMVWYTRNTEVLSKIYEKLNKRMKAQQNEINHLIAVRDKKPSMSAPGDSIDVWPWQHTLRLTGEMLNNQYAFVLPADTNYKDRDTLVWEVQYHFLKSLPVSSHIATMAMQIIYEKDTLNRIESITKPGMQKIRMFADTLGAIKEIKGFIYYPKGSKNDTPLLADRFSLTRYHCTDSLSATARDSINKVEALKTDSLKKVSDKNKHQIDSIQQMDDKDAVRLTPEELNRRRTGIQREKKPEQVEVEQHIQKEKRERQIMQRKNQQIRHQNPR